MVLQKLKELLEKIKGVASQGVSNIRGNIQAIASPQTRATWFRGFTPQLPQPIENIKTNLSLLSRPTTRETWIRGLMPKNELAQQFIAKAVSESVPFVTQRLGERLAPTPRGLPQQIAAGAGQFVGSIPSFIIAGTITAPLRGSKVLKLLSKTPSIGKFGAGAIREGIF